MTVTNTYTLSDNLIKLINMFPKSLEGMEDTFTEIKSQFRRASERARNDWCYKRGYEPSDALSQFQWDGVFDFTLPVIVQTPNDRFFHDVYTPAIAIHWDVDALTDGNRMFQIAAPGYWPDDWALEHTEDCRGMWRKHEKDRVAKYVSGDNKSNYPIVRLHRNENADVTIKQLVEEHGCILAGVPKYLFHNEPKMDLAFLSKKDAREFARIY